MQYLYTIVHCKSPAEKAFDVVVYKLRTSALVVTAAAVSMPVINCDTFVVHLDLPTLAKPAVC